MQNSKRILINMINVKPLITLISLLFLISCSNKDNYSIEVIKGVEIVKNSNIPNDPNLKIELKKIIEVNFSELAQQDTNLAIKVYNVNLDQFGNIYALDKHKQEIYKLDSSGKYLRTIGRKGDGPGEFRHETKHFEIIDDTICVSVPFVWKIIKFDLDGNFIVDKKYIKTSEFPDMFWKTGNFFCAMSYIPIPQEGENAYNIKLNVFNKRLNYINSFSEMHVNYAIKKLDLNNPENLFLAISSDSLIYVPKSSPNDYVIDVFDFAGTKKRSIRKNYSEIRYTPKEIEKIRQDAGADYIITGSSKNSIENILVDKYDRIWVKKALSEKELEGKNIQVFDLFKNGIYLNSVTLPFNANSYLDFDQNRAKVIDYDKNSTTIFDY